MTQAARQFLETRDPPQRDKATYIQGLTFLLEFDNSRNRGIPIHSVWRDFEHDFGYHLL